MAYYLDLFSPETYEAFSKSKQTISGFRQRQSGPASKIHPGDKLLCYLTKLSRWVGILEVQSGPFTDTTPIFYPSDDPFTLRFNVKPTVWLPKDRAVPIRENRIWDGLSLTRGLDRNSPKWTGRFRASLNPINQPDGVFLERVLLDQVSGGTLYPVNPEEYEKLLTHKAHRADKIVTVRVPSDADW